MNERTRNRRAALADAGRATRAAGAILHLVAALQATPRSHGLVLGATRAVTRALSRYNRRPCPEEAVAAMATAELVELSRRLDAYAEVVRRG